MRRRQSPRGLLNMPRLTHFQKRERLVQKLQKIRGAPRREIARALEEGAKQIVSSQKRLAPKKSGKLANSITYTKGSFTLNPAAITPGTQRREKRSEESRNIVGDADLTITITAGDEQGWYARLVEFGTAPHAQPQRGIMHPGSKPYPFFYPGYRLNKRSVQSKATRAAKKAIKASI